MKFCNCRLQSFSSSARRKGSLIRRNSLLYKLFLLVMISTKSSHGILSKDIKALNLSSDLQRKKIFLLSYGAKALLKFCNCRLHSFSSSVLQRKEIFLLSNGAKAFLKFCNCWFQSFSSRNFSLCGYNTRVFRKRPYTDSSSSKQHL